MTTAALTTTPMPRSRGTRSRRPRLGRLTMAGTAVAVAVLLGITGPAGAATCSGAMSKHPKITSICALMLVTTGGVLAYAPIVYCIDPHQADCQEKRRLMVAGDVVRGPGPDGYGTIASRLSAVLGIDNNDFEHAYVLNP